MQENFLKKYYSQIDGLRCIAILAVVLEHVAHFVGGPLNAGYFGVDLFFILSGFLITEILLIEKSSDKSSGTILKRFYIRRTLRIFPIYYLVCLLFFISSEDFRQISIYAFLYVLNWIYNLPQFDIPGYASHFWTLSVEEQFYLFWPFIILIFSNKNLKYLIPLVVIGSVCCFYYTGDSRITPSRLYELSGGGMLALMKFEYNKWYTTRIYQKVLITSVMLVLSWFVSTIAAITIFSFILIYLASNNGFKGSLSTFLSLKIVKYLGQISYGIYVYHKIINDLVGEYLVGKFWNKIDFTFFPVLRWHSYIVRFPIVLILSVLIAGISFKYFEKPILKYKVRFE